MNGHSKDDRIRLTFSGRTGVQSSLSHKNLEIEEITEINCLPRIKSTLGACHFSISGLREKPGLEM